MKINLAAKLLSLAVLFLAAGFIAGCKTTTTVDWNSRVGHYTMNQALLELGSPSKQTRLSDGRIVDQWITLHGHQGMSSGTAFAGSPDAMGAHPYVETYKDHVLELTFGPDGKLVSWAKNY